MEKILLLIAFLTLPLFLFCQQNEFNNWRVGTTVSFNLSSRSSFNTPKKASGLSLGIETAHRFTNRWELELGIGFSKIKRSDGCCEFCDCAPSPTSFFRRDIKYLDFSIMGNYYITQNDQLNIFASTGFEYNYLISPFNLDPLIITPSHSSFLINSAIGVGAEFRIFKQFQIRYLSKYIFGLSHVLKDKTDLKSNYINLSLGCGLRF